MPTCRPEGWKSFDGRERWCILFWSPRKHALCHSPRSTSAAIEERFVAKFELDKNSSAKSQSLAQDATERINDDILQANKIHEFVQLLKPYERSEGKELLDHIRSWNGHYRESLCTIRDQLIYLNGTGIFEKKELQGTVTSINRDVGQAETYGRVRGDSVKKFLAYAKSELEDWAKKNPGKKRSEQAGVSEENVKTLTNFKLYYTIPLNSVLAVLKFWETALK